MYSLHKCLRVAALVALLLFLAACALPGAPDTPGAGPAPTAPSAPVPGATPADPVDAFLTAATDLSGEEAAVRARLTGLARAYGLEVDYVARSSEGPSAWAGALRTQADPGQIVATFLLWQQDAEVSWEAFRGDSPFFPYLVNGPRGLRLQLRGGALEMGLITFNLGSGKDVLFILARLQAGHWQEIWSPAQAGGRWALGAPGVVEFTGAGFDRLRVAGPAPADLAQEAASCPRQLFESEWQRQDDSYVRVSVRCVP